MSIMTSAIIDILVKMAKKYLGPWLVSSIHDPSNEIVNRVSTTNGHVAIGKGNDKLVIDELKNNLEQQHYEHEKQLKDMMQKLIDIAFIINDSASDS